MPEVFPVLLAVRLHQTVPSGGVLKGTIVCQRDPSCWDVGCAGSEAVCRWKADEKALIAREDKTKPIAENFPFDALFA